MTAQEYIQSKLEELKEPLNVAHPQNDSDLADEMYRLLMSKKFRKYSANDDLIAHIKNAIRINIERNEPINVTFLHGAYKLWRLEESPEADWAELFALMHYTKWLKPICEVYTPGVWFDLFVDDLIVPHLGTASTDDVQAYLKSYQAVIDFLRAFQPANLTTTITTVGSRFATTDAFECSLQESIRLKQDELGNGLPKLTDIDIARTELNTNVTPQQLQDPQWREKVVLVESAYSRTKAEPGYHKVPSKILAFTTSIPGVALAVGSTKDSIAKFWVGAGALKPFNDSFRQIVLTPKQLASAKYHWVGMSVGIKGRNFNQIRVLEV